MMLSDWLKIRINLVVKLTKTKFGSTSKCFARFIFVSVQSSDYG